MEFTRKIVMYFSPTGGTRRVAEIIAAEFKTEHVYDITAACYNIEFNSDDLVVFCFPVFGGRMPKPMYDRFANIEAHSSACIPVAVFGNRGVDDALLEASLAAEKRGFTTVGGLQVVTRHSLNTKVAAGRPDDADRAVIREFVEKINSIDRIPVRMPGHKPFKFYPGMPLTPFAGLGCMRCCSCAKECPTGAITGPNTVDITKCISCMRCIAVCPSDNRLLLPPAKLAAAAAVKGLTLKRVESKYFI